MKKNEGITLVILVITIIILIILAVLGIALVVGDNGVLSQAKNSSENTIVSKEKEAISFALNALLADKTVFVIDEIDKDNLEQELNKNGDNIEVAYIDNNIDNGFLILFNDSLHQYTVDKDGKISLLDTKEDMPERIKHEVTFYTDEGTLSETVKYVAEGAKLGDLPLPTVDDLEFKGWFTEEGESVTKDTIMGNSDITYYAHWMKSLNNESSLSATISDIPTKTDIPIEIKINNDISENVVIPKDTNILLNLQDNTFQNQSNTNIINNSGTLEIIGGTIESTAGNYSAIDNNGTGTVILRDVVIISNNKQAICNKGGTIRIEGDTRITSKNAYAIENRSGEVTIISGSIIGERYTPISNKGTLIIGTNDGNVDISSPIIQGAAVPAGNSYNHAISENGSIYIYDGILKSKGLTITNRENNVKKTEEGYTLSDSKETIGDTEFNVTYLDNN